LGCNYSCSENSRSDEVETSIRAWQQELAWREFYQHAMYNFQNWQQVPPVLKKLSLNNRTFQTGGGVEPLPIVDAAMRQMNEIGWMHNRCRMIVIISY